MSLVRDRVLVPVTVAFCVVALVGIIAAAGGFQPSIGGTARDVAVGEPMTGSRFVVTVLSAELSDTHDSGAKRSNPVVLVRFELTNVSKVSNSYGPVDKALEFHLPNGEVTTDWLMKGTDGREAQYDPELPAGGVAQIDVDGQLWSGDQEVIVVVRDELPSDGLLASSGWKTGRPLGRVAVTCVDARQR